ncbi:MAG: MFS transporter [Chloroflexi bacterium]|nr:MFS transporter [Chloroflexota bacterium]MDA1239644.1 MFS transporter [Chloroflexota bacterium]MQC25606.1 MFS transporter [Chloroflexota bacterium]
MRERDLARTFLRWTFVRAVFHRGWWLVTSLYLVTVADLTASQLVFYGAVMAITSLLMEVPTGVVADTLSRKWSLVVSHVVMGSGMVMMGLVTDYHLILVTQVLWGLGWTFASGSDVAWVTDELDQPDRIAGVLIARAGWEMAGSAAGIVTFGVLAWAAGLGPAIVTAGAGMIVLGLTVVTRFPERNFHPARERHWARSMSILRNGIALARADRAIMLMFAATVLVNGGTEAYDFLFPRRLIDLGFPQEPDPIVWFTLLGLTMLAVGVTALRIVQSRIEGVDVARRAYALAGALGALGLLLLAHAPNEVVGIAGVVLVGGVALPVTRAVSVIWVNSRATSEVRATMQSFLAQGEALGEISAGVGFALLAQASSVPVVLTASAALVLWAGLLVLRAGATPRAA